jgi:hypothetical protein
MKRIVLSVLFPLLVVPSHACSCTSSNTLSQAAALIPYLVLCFTLAVILPVTILAFARQGTAGRWLATYLLGLIAGLVLSLYLASAIGAHGLAVNLALLLPPLVSIAVLVHKQKTMAIPSDPASETAMKNDANVIRVMLLSLLSILP